MTELGTVPGCMASRHQGKALLFVDAGCAVYVGTGSGETTLPTSTFGMFVRALDTGRQRIWLQKPMIAWQSALEYA